MTDRLSDRLEERLYRDAAESVPAKAHLTASASAFLRALIRDGLDRITASDEDFRSISEGLALLIRRAADVSPSIDAEALDVALAGTFFTHPTAARFFDAASASPEQEFGEPPIFRGRPSPRQADRESDGMSIDESEAAGWDEGEEAYEAAKGEEAVEADEGGDAYEGDRAFEAAADEEALEAAEDEKEQAAEGEDTAERYEEVEASGSDQAEVEWAMAEPPDDVHAGNGGGRQPVHEPSQPAEPPRKAWPRLDAPEVAVEGEPFDVVVGLRQDPDPQITGDALERPPEQRGPYLLTVHLVADGFRIGQHESWRRTLAVTGEQPYPTTRFTLTPGEESAPVRAERLVVYYAVDGQTIGQAVRAVAVVRSDALRREATVPEPPTGRNFTKPGRIEPVDLEVRIVYSEQRRRLLWTFSSRHELEGIPDEPPSTKIGTKPEEFGQSYIRDIETLEKARAALHRVKGLGRIVRDHIPDVFWRLLSAATDAARTRRGAERPAVLILSEEPYIPWELAYVKKPRIDDAVPPYLSVQVDVGRWALDTDQSDVQVSRRRGVESLAAITGTYDHPRWNDLAEAKTEARVLADTYGAVQVDAEINRILDLCADNPDLPDVLHFAVHGKYAPGQPGRGLVLLDGDSIHYLTDMDVRGFSLDTGPFVFLNACQVGSANEMLGNYAGLAHSFLAAGATAVIAPLWTVHDRVARELALEFYRGVAGGKPAVEALRQARMHCINSAPEDASAVVVGTPYAYLYYGHPELLFGWQLTTNP